jgi:hypothetical protein
MGIFFISASVARRATATASVIATMARGVQVVGVVLEGAKGHKACHSLRGFHLASCLFDYKYFIR